MMEEGVQFTSHLQSRGPAGTEILLYISNMPPINRKSAPRVKSGAVQKKNNWDLSEDYYYAPRRGEVVIDRQRPGKGYRHVLTKADIYKFLELLPDWDELAVGLNAIVLAPGEAYTQGYHRFGAVHICAWESDLWEVYGPKFYDDHRAIFDRLGVESFHVGDLVEGGDDRQSLRLYAIERGGADDYLCTFTERQVRGFQLLHILLHEIGHHHDRITTKSKRSSNRGEAYAERYALDYEARIWDSYVRAFAL